MHEADTASELGLMEIEIETGGAFEEPADARRCRGDGAKSSGVHWVLSVTSRPTMVTFQSAAKTRSAACGSFQMLASAQAVTRRAGRAPAHHDDTPDMSGDRRVVVQRR